MSVCVCFVGIMSSTVQNRMSVYNEVLNLSQAIAGVKKIKMNRNIAPLYSFVSLSLTTCMSASHCLHPENSVIGSAQLCLQTSTLSKTTQKKKKKKEKNSDHTELNLFAFSPHHPELSMDLD